MREIIHIQAGPLSNYTGTHYWNTQESYFVYDEHDDSITDYSISFKEGCDYHNQPTLCPRLLAFDQKSNFGTLARNSYPSQEEGLALWQGDVVRQEQERIPQSEYHSHLEEDSEEDNEQVEPIATKIRYWSDFSRVFFDPKSIHSVPDTPELIEGNWNASRETFARYDNVRVSLRTIRVHQRASQDVELTDGSLRLLAEDCNNFQGVQMIQDTSIFGGFSDALLTTFRAEHPKATLMTFACLSSISPLDANLGDSSQIKRVLNDALSLRSATEFCDLTVPILSLPQWEKSTWFSGYNVDDKSLYRSSAVLSTHIETVTLPLRLKGSLDDLQTMVAHLNWRKSSPLAMLRGTLYPHGLSTQNLQDLSSLSFRSDDRALFARRDVSRGFTQNEVAMYDAWGNAHELKQPFLMWHHLPGYPIPSSFPPIFPDTRPKTLKLVSSMSTTPSTGGYLSDYAHFVENAAKRHDSALLAMGLEEDELRELVGALWDIVDAYGDEEGDGYPSESMGEDEEQ